MKLAYVIAGLFLYSATSSNCMQAQRFQENADTYQLDLKGQWQNDQYSNWRHSFRNEKIAETHSKGFLPLACGCLVVMCAVGWACTSCIRSSKEKTD